MRNKPSKGSKPKRWFREPFRFLEKAKNLYIGCMYGCAKWVGHGDGLGLSATYFSPIPIRTFPSRDADDLQDLIRANSGSNLINRVGSRIEVGSKSDPIKKKQQSRKCCNLIATIDEDKPCEFGDDLKVKAHFLLRPRSRRNALTTRGRFVG